MRTYSGAPTRTYTVADIFANALALLRQDAGEYAFVALIGASAASFTTFVLRMLGGPVAVAVVAPVIALSALLTMAACVAAVRRVNDNLEPDSVRALGAVIVRLPAIVIPVVPSLIVLWIAAFSVQWLDDYIGSLLAGVMGIAVALLAVQPIFRRGLYVPALFARGASVGSAAANAAAMMAQLAGMVTVVWAIALAPAALVAFVALAAGFGVVSTTLTAFAIVACMPLAAAMLSLVHDAMPATSMAPQPSAAREPSQSADVSDRLRRHMR